MKKFAAKLKKIFTNKSKVVKAPEITTAKAKKIPQRKIKSHIDEKVKVEETKRKPYKKETPEEYRLRHEKKAQNKNLESQTKTEVKIDNWDASVFKVDIVDNKTRFHDLNLPKEIMHSVFDLGFQYCSEVQSEVLPKSMSGKDITVQAQTGTGKTAAFLITILNHIIKNPLDIKQRPGTPRALILAPTRELVLQIEKDARSLGKYLDISILSILGGMDYKKQQNTLKYNSCDILICTPGRLIDFMHKRFVHLKKVEILIIDEADRMLDMGFIPDVKKIVVSTPEKAKRQTMFFSATLSGDVKRLAESWTRDAIEIIIKPENVTEANIEQITYITTIEEKPTLLYNIIMQKKLERVLVFANRKDDAKKVKEKFEAYGISCALLSGDIEQSQRIKRLERFREGKVRVLVATNVASRGIHIDGISHVINYNMPQDVEEYVHRIGRTGRAGAAGVSISFADEDDSHEINKLEEYLDTKIKFTFPEAELLVPIPEKHQNIKHDKPSRNKSYKKNYKRPDRRK
ncbi:MAG: DEAD/DEAH box helicase [Ignavibacteriae bacterium]|nr:DEAD/DEAH box helicase [Ignavibacteriota bacterium]